MENVENNISKIPAVQEKFQVVLKKNKGYKTMKLISAYTDGINCTLENIE